MKILIIGGTRFLGWAIVDAVLEAGHTPVSRTMNGVMVSNRKGKLPCWRSGTNHIEPVTNSATNQHILDTIFAPLNLTNKENFG